MDHLIQATLNFWLSQTDVAGASKIEGENAIGVSFTDGTEFFIEFQEA